VPSSAVPVEHAAGQEDKEQPDHDGDLADARLDQASGKAERREGDQQRCQTPRRHRSPEKQGAGRQEHTGHVGVTVIEAVGHGRQRGITHEYRGRIFESRFLPKAYLFFVVKDEIAAGAVEAIVDAEMPLEAAPPRYRGEVATRYRYRDGDGELGLIASVTRPFCGDCDRTRLTADGQIRSCLFARTETDLRALLRGGADDAEIAQVWRQAMWGKLAGHGIDQPGFRQPDRPMSAIGG